MLPKEKKTWEKQEVEEEVEEEEKLPNDSEYCFMTVNLNFL